MKRLISILAVAMGLALPAVAATPAPLSTLSSIVALSNAEAAKGLPVVFEATITYLRPEVRTMFVQDGDAAIFVGIEPALKLSLGDRIQVQGKTVASFRPDVIADSVTVLRHGDLPNPLPANFDELIRVQHDCMLVTVHGIVRSADTRSDWMGTHGTVQLQTDGGYMLVLLDDFPSATAEALLDAEVEVTGVAAGDFDGKMQMHGVRIYSSSQRYVKVLRRAPNNPWTLPLTPMDQVISGYHVVDRTQRVRVHGSITYYHPGTAVVLQDGAKSLWIATTTFDPLVVGDVVDATGFPEAHNGFLALTRGEIRDSHRQAPVAPIPATRKELAQSFHVMDLVSVEGEVVTAIHGGTQDEYHLMADGQMFTAIFTHPIYEQSPTVMKQVPVGSRVRATGICITENSNPFSGETSFDILIRDFDDITLIARPSLINTRNLLLALTLALGVVFVVSAWGWTLRRKVRIQTAALARRAEAEAALERRSAQLEMRRSAILEEINKSQPLSQTLQKITEMVSFGLKGAPCWIELYDQDSLWDCAQEALGLRVVRCSIISHERTSLGALAAGFDPFAPVSENEQESLSSGARLAALAIETHRLYKDLRRRSEFDLLTDILNRFSLENRLNLLIEDSRLQASLFGLIYIDLDKFKQINDLYGHHIGDLYLKNVALRMNRQIRFKDTLARLGGDEFAVLVAAVRDRAELSEIALRLERCFDEPFNLDGIVLNGSASVGIALYPQDGTSKDEILNAADAAMYAAKNAKRQIESSLRQLTHS
jgi:diguanylate cyclase (GGDEF)-like protein